MSTDTLTRPAEQAPAVEVPAGAEALVILALLERRERDARTLRDRCARIVTEERQRNPDEPPDYDTELWSHGVYTRWSEAFETLAAARKALEEGN